MEYKDYYKILGVSKNANDKAIKRAYYQFARHYHPDPYPGDKKAEETFKDIKEAYEGLGKPDRRARLVRRWHNADQFHQLAELA